MHEENEGRTMGGIATAVVALVALVLSAGSLIVAAGADGGGPATVPAASSTDAADSAADSVAVELSEFAISPSNIEVAAGGTLEVRNSGAVEHDLAVVGTDVATPMIAAGQSSTLDLGDLAPGVYDVYCTVAGHDSAGMTGTLTILGEGDAQAASDDHADHGAADEDWAALDQAMHDSILAFPAETEGSGNQLLEPEEILDDGTKVFRLVAETFDWEVEPGKVVEGWGYNGQIPGPMIKVDVGDNVRVIVENDLPMGTDVHWHGVRVPTIRTVSPR